MSPSRRVPPVLLLLALGHACSDVVQGAIPALLPFVKERFGLTYAVTASLLMATHVTSSCVQPLFGWFTDRRPFPPLLVLGLSATAAGAALLAHAPSFAAAAAFVVLTGLGSAAFHPEGFKATACLLPDRRATGMSLFSVGGNFGFALGGPLAITLVTSLAFARADLLALFPLAAALLLLPALPLLKERTGGGSRPSPRGAEDGAPRPHAARAMTLLVLVVIFRSWTQLGVSTFLPFLHREELSRNPAFVSALVFVFLGAGTAGTLLGGPLADRVGHRRTLFYSLALQVPLLHLLLRAEGAPLFLLAALSGAAIVSTFSVTIVMAQELFPRRLATVAGAIGGFAMGAGGAGTTLLGAAADRAGIEGAAGAMVLLPLVGAILTLLIPLPWGPGALRRGSAGVAAGSRAEKGGGTTRPGGS